MHKNVIKMPSATGLSALLNIWGGIWALSNTNINVSFVDQKCRK
jgi:hypothetical protein